MPDPRRLRKLAAFYWEFAERAASPAIWEMRLRLNTAEGLEAEAARLELRRPLPQQSAKARLSHLAAIDISTDSST
jgi:hypothetical protein